MCTRVCSVHAVCVSVSVGEDVACVYGVGAGYVCGIYCVCCVVQHMWGVGAGMWFGLSAGVVFRLCPMRVHKCVCCVHAHVRGCDFSSGLIPYCHPCPNQRAEEGVGGGPGYSRQPRALT